MSIALVIIAIVVGLISGFSQEHWFLEVVILICYGFLLLIFHRLYNLLNWIDPTVLFSVSYVTFLGVGIAISGYYHIVLGPPVVLASIVGLALFFLGAVTFDSLTTLSGRIKTTRSVSIIATYYPGEIVWAWVFLFIGIFVLLYYYYSVGTIPLLAENAENIRLVMKAGRGYLPIAGFALLSVSTAMLVAIYAKQHYIFVISLVVVIAAALLLGVGYRILPVRLLLNGFIIYSFVRRSRISGVALISLTVTIVALLSVTGFYRLFGHSIQSLEQIGFALRRSAYAMFVRYLGVLDLVMAYFPDIYPFMLGQSYFISASTIMPGPQLHFGFWLVERLGLVLSSPGPVDPTILGEFYANFGWIGIVVGMFTLGAGLRALYRLLEAKPSLSITRLVLMTLLSTSFISVVGSGLALGLLFDILPLVAVFIAYRFCVRTHWSTLRPSHISVNTTTVDG